MAKELKIGKHVIGEGHPVYIIAEIGINHNGDIKIAEEMIRAAKNAGVEVRITHAHNTCCNQKFLHVVLRPFFDRSYTAAAACGDAAGRFLYGEKPFTVLKNGIETAKFAFDADTRRRVREKMNVGDRFVVLHVGGFNDYKNQVFLINPLLRAMKNRDDLVMFFARSIRSRRRSATPNTGNTLFTKHPPLLRE